MYRRWSLGLVLGLMFLLSGAPELWAQPAFNHMCFPVTTQLQQKLIGDPEVTCVLIVRGTLRLGDEGKLIEAPIDMEAIKKSLTDEKRKGGKLWVYSIVGDFKFEDFDKTYQDRFEPFAKSLGFNKVKVTQEEFSEWPRFVKIAAGKPAGDSTTKEDAVKKKGVTIYPVRTALSRYLTHSPDCVVIFEEPFPADWDGLLEPEMYDDIKAAIGEVKFDTRDCLHFRITSEQAAFDAVGRFALNRETGRSLGFRDQTFHWIEK
jgi:hypothetical protein